MEIKKVKHYICKRCGESGTRKMIRKHLREEHMVRGLRKDSVGKKLDSQLTANTIVKEIE